MSITDPAGGGAVQSPSPREFVPGTIISDRYRIVSLLGAGGMGAVYRADDLKLGSRIALKHLPASVGASPARVSALYHELRMGREISHANVCRLHDIVETPEGLFISMELIDGDDLSSLLRRVGRVPAERAIAIARDLCAALSAAHARGIVHRDLKPANILVDAHGVAHITDFGLAIPAGGGGGGFAGTPPYMAPEQLDGEPATIQTDIYALGLVLYELFTGARVFRVLDSSDGGARLIDLRAQHTAPRTAPRQLVSEIDSNVENVILRCIEESPASRPRSVNEVLAALPVRDALQEAVDAGRTPPPEMVAAASVERTLTPARVAALLALLIVSLLLTGYAHDAATVEGFMPRVKSRESLIDTSHDVARLFGADSEPEHVAAWFARNTPYLRVIARGDRSPRRWNRLRTTPPAALHFLYRASSTPLRVSNLGGPVTTTDPAATIPGSVFVRLDAEGQLLSFHRVPMARAPPPQRRPEWSRAFLAAGLDARTIRPAAPVRMPPVGHDARQAWTGRWERRPEIPLRIEAASLRGIPVAFEIVEPWPGAPPPVRGSSSGAIALAILRIAALTLAFPAAIRNARSGRNDRAAARRIAIFTFAAVFVSLIGTAWHTVDPAMEVEIVFRICGAALVWSAQVWLIYAAVEPYVRRHWPHVLVGWTRLLHGAWRDSVVGQSVLAGAVTGSITAAFFTPYELYPAFLRRAAPVLASPLTSDAMRRVVGVFSEMADAVVTTLLYALGLLFLWVVIRSRVKQPAIGFAATVLVVATVGLRADAPIAGYVMWALLAAVLLALLRRMGLLALVVALTVHIALVDGPITLDFARWYAPRGAAIAAFVFAAALYGAAAGVSRQRNISVGSMDRTVRVGS